MIVPQRLREFFCLRCHALWPVLFALLAPALTHAEEYSLEQKIKASYVFNVLRFVSWPKERFTSEAHDPSTLRLCLVGDDALSALLRRFDGRVINERLLNVMAYADGNVCHAAYIASSEEAMLAHWLRRMQQSQTLTLSDITGFVNGGGMVGFRRYGGRVVIELNPAKLEGIGVEVDAQLLEIAHLVELHQGSDTGVRVVAWLEGYGDV